VEARALGCRPWERNSILFAVILNVFFSRNLDQRMLKNAYFGGKTVKVVSAFASGGWALRPQTLALLLPPAITTLSSLFLVLNAFYSAHKKKQVNTANQWRSKGGGKSKHAPWGAGLEGATAHFLQSFETCF